MNKFLNQLKKIEKDLLRLWKKEKKNVDIFPFLAKELLEKHQLHLLIKNKNQILKHIIKENKHQDIHHYDLNSTKNLHYTLIRNDIFFIELYSWVDHTEIHAHNFIGAFQVLTGKFIQSTYDFSMSRSSRNITTGKLNYLKSEDLKVGDAVAIIKGEGFIHQVLHYNNPSISLCIRMADTRESYFSYFYPSLRITDITFKKTENLRIKAFVQLCHLENSFMAKEAMILIKGLTASRLLYDYMIGLPSFDLKLGEKHKLEKLIEKYFLQKKIDILFVKKNHRALFAKLNLGFQ
jgi:hypothetical protein